MRKIKFRAICRETKEMVYGYYADGFIVDFENDLSYKVDKNTVEQYTGVNDKTGKEIFEGDIVKDDMGELIIVKWVPERLSYRFFGRHAHNKADIFGGSYKFGNPPNNWFYPDNCIEVTGNIHENKNLLGE